MLEITAHEAFERYEDALKNGWLRQGTWNSEEGGRRVACMLGTLDPSVNSAYDCPATVMPRWLARMVPNLFDRQAREDAFAWGEKFYRELDRLNGQVPFEIVYKWHAEYSWPMGIAALKKLGRDTSAAEAIQTLHARAMAGDRATRETWYKTLRNAAAADADAAYAAADAAADAAYAADAYADAAYADAAADAAADARQRAWATLADGLVECLKSL